MQRILLGAALALTACGGSAAPTTPSAPTIAQVGGVWSATKTVTTISTTECVGQALVSAGTLGSRSTSTVQITESGAALTVTDADALTGGTATYTGTAGASSIALVWQRCSACALTHVACGGIFRDILPQSGSATAALSGATLTGTGAITYNTVLSGTSTPLGILTITNSFMAVKQ